MITSHPHLDRLLVEFMLGIPISVLAAPGEPRGLMRRAFASFMPPRIVARFSKGFALAFYLRNTRDVLLRWIDSPDKLKIVQLDFLDPSLTPPGSQALRDSGKQPEFFMQLLKIEQWLDSREQDLSRVRLSRPVSEASRNAVERVAVASAK